MIHSFPVPKTVKLPITKFQVLEDFEIKIKVKYINFERHKALLFHPSLVLPLSPIRIRKMIQTSVKIRVPDFFLILEIARNITIVTREILQFLLVSQAHCGIMRFNPAIGRVMYVD